MNFVVSANLRLKIKEIEKSDDYMDIDRKLEPEPAWNMRVEVSVLETVPKSLEKGPEQREISRRIKTIQTTASLRSAKILRSVLETWEKLSLGLQWKWEISTKTLLEN